MDNNFQINNIMEMAMGLSMASLFSRAMGQAMESSMGQIANAGAKIGEPVFENNTSYIYAMINGKQYGPLTLSAVETYIRDGRITLETYMWKSGMKSWMQAKDIMDIAPEFGIQPPPFNLL